MIKFYDSGFDHSTAELGNKFPPGPAGKTALQEQKLSGLKAPVLSPEM